MKKNNMIFFLIALIILAFGGAIILKSQINNKANVTKPEQKETTPTTTSSLPLNDNSYPLNMIEGTIDKIYSTTPLKMDVNVRISKILANQKEKDAIKTIITKADTNFVVTELDSKKETPIKPSSFQVKEDIVVWIAEPNTDLLKLNQFTATKIVKFNTPNNITPTGIPIISNTPTITNTVIK